MKAALAFLLLLATGLATAWSAPDATEPKFHPVQGVVMGLMPEKTALLVKHEEVPGVMRAMTMMFKVEPAVLEQVKPGDAIKALMSRREDGWWLTEIEIIAPAGKS